MPSPPLSETPVAIVVTPWLPTPGMPYAGSFVADFVRYAIDLYGAVATVHLDDSFRSNRPLVDSLAARSLTRRTVHRLRPTRTGASVHVPLPVLRGSGWRTRVTTAERVGKGLVELPRAMSERGLGRLPAHIHAHVGFVAGTAALPWIEDNELFLYEHASFLASLLGDDGWIRDRYANVLERATAIRCVNPDMAEQLADLYPAVADRIGVHPNAVSFDGFRPAPRSAPLRRWLYVGNVKREKGSRRLAEAFRLARDEFPDVTLTVVGTGPDLDLFEEPDIADSITVMAPVSRERMPEIMGAADLLVHLSEGETFGMTTIEAVATGLPVLVTSTDGSRFTIGPVAEQAGSLIEQPATPESVVDAYRELRALPDRLDLRAARQSLEDRFSFASAIRELADLTSGSRPRTRGATDNA